MKLWLQVWFYSVGIAVVLILLGVMPMADITIYQVLDFIFPIQTEHYWFATAYVFMYLFSPVLNVGIKGMTQKQHRNVILGLLLVFSIVKSVVPFNLNMDSFGYDVVWFMCLYMVAGYIRRYGIPFFSGLKKSLITYVSITTVMYLACMAVGGFYKVTGKLADFVTKPYQYNHILNVFASVALFYVFYHLKIKGRIAEVICRISPYVFGVYLLHEHIGLRYVWPQWFKVNVYGRTLYMLPHLLITVLLIFAAGVLLDFCRNRLFVLAEKGTVKLIKKK